MPVAPTVSVVIPTYRRADKIRAVIDSVLTQTWQDFEIVVVDDASGDGTGDVVRAVPDPRVRFVEHETNQGGNAARRTGIAHSRGEYVAFLDSDDIWLPTKLEKQIGLLRAKGPRYGYCTTWFQVETPTGEVRMYREPRIDGARVPELCVANEPGGFSMLVVRADVLDQVGGPDPSLPACQDWDLNLRLNDVTAVCTVEEHLVRYLQDIDDPVRITTRRASVVTGHRHMYREVRRRRSHLDAATLAESQARFAEYFANAGAPADVARVVLDTPLRAWLQPGIARRLAHMSVRGVRKARALGERTKE